MVSLRLVCLRAYECPCACVRCVRPRASVRIHAQREDFFQHSQCYHLAICCARRSYWKRCFVFGSGIVTQRLALCCCRRSTLPGACSRVISRLPVTGIEIRTRQPSNYYLNDETRRKPTKYRSSVGEIRARDRRVWHAPGQALLQGGDLRTLVPRRRVQLVLLVRLIRLLATAMIV